MGEDLIVHNFLNYYGLNLSNVYYLDIGANNPREHSNTCLLYENGSRGVLVEPDSTYWPQIKHHRPEDKLLKYAVGKESKENVPFYIMTAHSLNTISEKYRDAAINGEENYGKQKVEEVITVDVKTINSIIDEQCSRCPNFLSVDVEGLDYDILTSLDYDKYRPELICVEINEFHTQMPEFMSSKGYRVIADNTLNFIFAKLDK